MLLHTNCAKCYFADKVNSTIPCKFYIPDAIKHIKTIDTIDDFFYIHDYTCKYGVSRDAVENKITQQHKDINITEYAKNQAGIKYVLYIKITSFDFINICKQIQSLSISPEFVHMVFDVDYDIQNIAKIAEQQLKNAPFKWKLHKFLENEPDTEQLYVSFSTNKVSKANYIWILNDTLLVECANNDSINLINYIINIEQPLLAILKKNVMTEYFYGLFMSLDNLHGIWNNLSHNLDKSIKSLYNDNDIQSYD